MHGAAAYTLTDRFTWLIDGLCRAIGSDAYKRRVDAVLVLAIWNRVRRLSERFLAEGRGDDTKRAPTPIGPLCGPIPRKCGRGRRARRPRL